MRRFVPALAALVLAPALVAQAAPRSGPCTHVATDPTGDTYALPAGPSLHAEPGMDITALDFGSDAKTLTVVTSIADVDAPMVASPLGRGTWVILDVSEASFLVAVAQGIDASNAHLGLGEIDERIDQAGTGTGAATFRHVADLTFRVDAARNQLRVDVPLAELRKHTGGIGPGARLSVRQVSTFDIQGTSTAFAGRTADVLDAPATWTMGARSCA